MTPAPDKTWIAILSLASGVLLVVAVCLSLAVAGTRAEVRHALDTVESIADKAATASKVNPTQACEILWQLHSPSYDQEGPPHVPLSSIDGFVEGQRKRAVAEVIQYLRLKTGDDLDAQPENWILKYGSQSVKESLKTSQDALAAYNMGPYRQIHNWGLRVGDRYYGVQWVGAPENRIGLRAGRGCFFVCQIWQAILGVLILVLLSYAGLRSLTARSAKRRDG